MRKIKFRCWDKRDNIMKIKLTSYNKIKKMICKPITKKDIKLFMAIHPTLFGKSIAEQEDIQEEFNKIKRKDK